MSNAIQELMILFMSILKEVIIIDLHKKNEMSKYRKKYLKNRFPIDPMVFVY